MCREALAQNLHRPMELWGLLQESLVAEVHA